MKDVTQLMAEIERVLADGGRWCDLEKAQTLASMVVSLRPRVVCEIGVWMGGSLVPMMLALRTLRELDVAGGRDPVARKAIAIDPWERSESVVGQEDADAAWWASVDHEEAMRAFLARVERHALQNFCEVVRSPSDQAPAPPSIDLLHVDGNHAQQARRDVERFAPGVVAGGILILDDLTWTGGHVRSAREFAQGLGFRDLYPLGTGVVMRRES